MTMAYIIKTSGEIIETTPRNGNDFELDELQAIVGGYIEVVNLRDGKYMGEHDLVKKFKKQNNQ